MPSKILLLSGYDAASHQQWRNSLSYHLPQFEWLQVALKPRHFAWRTRGSSLSLAFDHQEQLKGDFDCLVVTSMVDLASLRGFKPSLATIPTIVYFHENQFVYPVDAAQPNIINAQVTSIYSALCADKVVFNSQYNRSSFLSGARKLFSKLPEASVSLIDSLESKAIVLAVPIENPQQRPLQKKSMPTRPIEIVWNHRWEYDKQPQVFFDAMGLLKKSGIDFRLHILGQSFRSKPKCFAAAKQEFNDEIVSWGYQDRKDYDRILAISDIVISSALHDFQGLSMLEAVANGCIPLAPNRVAYPEYLPPQNLYSVSNDPVKESQMLYIKLTEIITAMQCHAETLSVDVSNYYATNLIMEYELLIKNLLSKN